MNTSSRLDWTEQTAPILTDYMVRMREAGYTEIYRKIILEKAFKKHDRIVKDAAEGKTPMHRSKNWKKEERITEKRRKKHAWATRGGCIDPHNSSSYSRL